MKISRTIVNVTAEPQFTIFHEGAQQPAVQFFVGLTLQWKKEHQPKRPSGT